MAEKVTGAEALIEALAFQGVDTIFGYPGGAIMPVYDALHGLSSKVKHILVRHEQGASHAAEGYARITGKPGVCLATSGPGATNLVTGIADAMLDSIPIVCITGQVASPLLGTDAFQETDVIGITIPITKWNYQVTRAEEIPAIIAKAFYVATSGRPGPVLVDITKDAQMDTMERQEYKLHVPVVKPYAERFSDLSGLQEAAKLINESERPFMLIGHGVKISQAEQEVLALAEKAGIPAACTLHGLSAFPQRHELYVGMLGMHGNYGPNVLKNQADLIIAIGMRFDDRVTGTLDTYLQNSKVIHIEVDAAEIDKIVKADVALVADAKLALKELHPLLQPNTHKEWVERFRECDKLEYEKVIAADTEPADGKIKMSEAIHMLSEVSGGDPFVVSDVGQHQMMAARYYKASRVNSFISSGGLGTMGFALPAGLGAKVGDPERQVVVVVGDGGFQMTLQELATIAQEQLPVKILILNNNYLGMVRQWQELFFDRRYSEVHLQNPDFVQICKGFGVNAARVQERSQLKKALEDLLASEEAGLLEIMVGKEDNVFPMVAAGSSIDEMRLT